MIHERNVTCTGHITMIPKGRTRRLQQRALSRLRPPCSRPSPISGECRTPYREPLRFIVITVMSVIGGTFPTPKGFLRDGQSLASSGTVMPSSRLPSSRKRLR